MGEVPLFLKVQFGKQQPVLTRQAWTPVTNRQRAFALELEFPSQSEPQRQPPLKQVAERYISSVSNLIHIRVTLPQVSGDRPATSWGSTAGGNEFCCLFLPWKGDNL